MILHTIICHLHILLLLIVAIHRQYKYKNDQIRCKKVDLVAAVSLENGIEAFKLFDEPINSIKYCKIVEEILQHGSNAVFVKTYPITTETIKPVRERCGAPSCFNLCVRTHIATASGIPRLPDRTRIIAVSTMWYPNQPNSEVTTPTHVQYKQALNITKMLLIPKSKKWNREVRVTSLLNIYYV